MKGNIMRTKLYAGVAFAALVLPSAAFAQSTGSTDFDEETEIVVTGTAIRSVGGVQVPETPKTKVVIDSELIQRQRPGQTVNDIINLSPGVSFQNNDASGAAGGTFSIRGFDSTRISQTMDGIPLNDTGNYAIYSNQQQDPETLESVSVSLGSTDSDSPTASASGGTVNIRTRVPGESLGAYFSGMVGTYAASGSPFGNRNIYRGFAMLDSGDFTGIGTRAFASASWTKGDNPFNNYGKLEKAQWNARVYQELGGSGDFVSVSGHYNQNRNNFFGSSPLRNDFTQFPNSTAARFAGSQSSNRYPNKKLERFYNINYPCMTDTPQAGVADAPAPNPGVVSGASCGTEFDRRYNPSNTGNIRGNSRFTLAEGLTLTIDPSFQYVKANGGGTITGREQARLLSGTNFLGFSGNNYYFNRDLNGDGDTMDQVTLISPSQTTTRRYVVVSNLSYEINEDHRVRVFSTYDRGRHRQTGEVGFVAPNGEPYDVFPVNDPVTNSLGTPVQKRDRLSYAILKQVGAEYRGKFGGLTVVLGITGKQFTRDLTQNCFTTSASGFVDCVDPSQNAAYAAANPYAFFGPGVTSTTNSAGATVTRTAGSCTTSITCVLGFQAPQQRVYKYEKALPNVGLTYDFGNLTAYASYAKGISVPGTDTLYSAFYFPTTNEQAQPKAENTDTFETGLRYRKGRLSAQIGSWYTAYKNRIATAYDPELDQTITRNLGDVTKWGFDGSIAYKPTPDLLLYVFGSYLHSEIKDDLLLGTFDTDNNSATAPVAVYSPTAGKREAGAPVYTFGARVQGTLGPVDIGIQAKRTGKRYVNDENLPIQQCYNAAGTANGSVQRGTFCGTAANSFTPGLLATVYPASAEAYTLVDLDIRVNMAQWGLDKTYLQFNVTNLADVRYVGSFGGSSNRFTVPFVQIGVPRAITGAIVVGF